MLDPLTAIGLASAIVQFVDFSTKILHGAQEMYESASGATEENRSLEVVVSDVKRLSSKLKATCRAQQSDDEKALCSLAEECNSLSADLFELLQKVKSKDSKSKRQAALAALKNKRYESKKLGIEKRLESCRSQLGLQISLLTRSETESSLRTLAEFAKDNAIKLEAFQKDVEQLRRGTKVTSISPEAREQLRKLFSLPEEAYDQIAQHRVLKSLASSDMHGRFEAIDTAHFKTFEWIFEGGAKAEAEVEDFDRDRSSGESFIHWLSSGHGIFHISGKLGSGKSTLMKFLCDHSRTRAGLEKWAGNKKLVFAKFFFWRPGTTLQRSLTGLFRSLLHDMLKECPKLIPQVLPKLWKQTKSTLWQVQEEVYLSKEVIRTAFTQLIENRSLYKDHCFCFFIDGLDEYEETRQEDYKDMVEILCSWTTTAPENVKICVSSREYNVFLNNFSAERRLRLQDLTRADMERFVGDKLVGVNDEKGEKGLVENILDRADGIFLWVALVVKTLRRRLEDGYKVHELQRELDSLPPDLEDLFKHLLKSIPESARRKIYQTVSMLEKLKPYGLDFTLLHYSFLDDYEHDPNFAMESCFPAWSDGDAAKLSRIDLARKKLNGDCGGLLEASDGCITFAHRSIPEFLEGENIQTDMKLSMRGSSPEEAISQLFLAELRSEGPEIWRERWSHNVYAIIGLRIQASADRAPYHYRDCLRSAVLQHQEANITESSIRNVIIRVRISNYYGIGHMPGGAEGGWNFTIDPIQISAFCGDHRYVSWIMKKDPAIIHTAFELSCLLGLTIIGALVKRHTGCLEILGFLLEQGQPPNAVVCTDSTDVFNGSGRSLSLWQSFLLKAATEDMTEYSTEFKSRFGETLAQFLRCSADPYFWIRIEKVEENNPESKANPISGTCEPLKESDPEWESEREESEKEESEKEESESEEPESEKDRLIVICGRERRMAAVEVWHWEELEAFISEKGGEISLRDLLERWQLENTGTLLQLMDKNIQQEQVAKGEGGRQEQTKKEEDTAEDQPRHQQEEEAANDVVVAGPEIQEEPTPEPEVIESKTAQDRRSTPFQPWFDFIARGHFLLLIFGVLLAIGLPQVWVYVF